MAKTVCRQDQCVGCMACVDLCPQKAISILDTCLAYNAVIDPDKCIDCGICTKVCQNHNQMHLVHPKSWYQGWIKEEALRGRSSSGGAAKALSRKFVRLGGVVISCCFEKGAFCFRKAEHLEELEHFTGSKYVKSNPGGVYRTIQKTLKQGKKVLFIGLPCQVAAVQTVLGKLENLYTVDLICHGTPSPKLLEDFLALKKIDLGAVDTIAFRHKGAFGIEATQKPLSQPGSVDDYLLTFLCGLDYTENCYHCKFAGIERGSDLTIGDSWESDLPQQEQQKGISLILCQTEKGEALLKQSEMELYPVDLEHAIQFNAQLREPTVKTKRHDLFFEKYLAKDFNRATFCCLPYKCIKQSIKRVLLKMKILKCKEVNFNISISMNRTK